MLDAAPPDSSVLVAVVSRPTDLERALVERWYRIPVARAPRPLAADYLALYLTGRCGPLGACIRYIAVIRRCAIRRRRDLLPEEPQHPRADQLYYRLALDQWHELERPIPAGALRRITFIYTTLERLLSAGSVKQLWLRGSALRCLCRDLRAEGYSPADRRLREESRCADCPVLPG